MVGIHQHWCVLNYFRISTEKESIKKQLENTIYKNDIERNKKL